RIEHPLRTRMGACRDNLCDIPSKVPSIALYWPAWRTASVRWARCGSDERWRTVRDRHRRRLAGGRVRLLVRVLGALLAVSGALAALLVTRREMGLVPAVRIERTTFRLQG